MNRVRLSCTLLIAANAILAAHSAGIDDDLTLLIGRTFGTGVGVKDKEAIHDLTSEEKEAIRDRLYLWLKNVPGNWQGNYPNNWFIDALMDLGDDWARDILAAKFRERPDHGWHDWSTYRDPKLISRVGDMLLLNDVVTEEMNEAGYAGRQSWTATTLLDTLGNAPAFSADVINWARRLQEMRSRQTVAIMREWWKANEALLKANDFKAVQPGRSLPEEKAPEPTAAPTLIANSASPNVVATPLAEPIAQPASTPSSAFLWTGAGVAIALLVGLGVFWKRRV